MEGAAIAQTCLQLKTPFVVIRSLSDIAGKESPHTFEEYLEVFNKHMPLLLCSLLVVH
jgi:adenosylhomocysteine nucleosidase